MKLQKEKVAKARELGRLAFHAGLRCAPCLDAALPALMIGNRIGKGLPVLTAWLKKSSRGHQWETDEYGHIDIFAFNPSDTHNGPKCVICGYGYCHHCHDGPQQDCIRQKKKTKSRALSTTRASRNAGGVKQSRPALRKARNEGQVAG